MIKTECLLALRAISKKVIFMTLKVKAGTPSGVHRDIPGTSGKDDVREFDESERRSRPTDVTELRGRGKEDINLRAGGLNDVLKDHPTVRPKDGYARERVYTDKRAGTFLKQMEEGFSPGETNQVNPFGPPAVGSTKPRTLSEAMRELVFRFKILMVEIFMPEGYEVVQVAPQRFLRDFLLEARELWRSYEPLLGRRVKSDSILQVEAPPEEDE